MDKFLRFRCSSDLKEKIEKESENQGFSSVSEYIRLTLQKDIKSNE